MHCVFQPFLQWKHPVRIHTHKKSVQPPEEAWKDISEGFYDDYIDTHNSGPFFALCGVMPVAAQWIIL